MFGLVLEPQEGCQGWQVSQLRSNQLDTSLDAIGDQKKIRNHRGLRHYWGIRVRGQHTKTLVEAAIEHLIKYVFDYIHTIRARRHIRTNLCQPRRD